MSSLSTTVAIADSSALFRLGAQHGGPCEGIQIVGKPAPQKTWWGWFRVLIPKW